MRGATFRRAVAASIGVHVLLAIGLVLLSRWQASQPRETRTATIDTRAAVRFEFVSEEPEATVEVQPTPEVPPIAPGSPSTEVTGDSGPPLANAIAIPRTLPSELFGLLRKSTLTEVPVRPVAATTPRSKPGPTWAAAGSPVHGALDSKQCIVYVLDASASMGEWGKFDAALGALIATLRLQPESVRFQVVIYSGTASIPLRGPSGECLPATAENLARMIEVLRAVASPAGRSNHVEGLRTALALRPDLVLIFTDADELPATAFRGIVRQAAKPATICVARVNDRGVGTPVEVK